ncbi:MAG: DUF2520 domain-containing protein [Myxococcales bacterium]
MSNLPRKTRVLILGRGRVGGALARAWRRAGLRVRVAPGRSATVSSQGFEVIVLAVPDGAVAGVASRLAASLEVHRPLVAHCAGSLDLGPLEPLRRLGCPVGSLHPLQAVPSPAVRLSACAGIDASSAGARRLLRSLASQAGLSPLSLDGADRALYHAAAALASNGLAGLLSRTEGLLRRCGASPRMARRAALGLMSSALGRPLTGPIARGDARTVRAHVSALARLAPEDLDLYVALARAQIFLAQQQTGPTRGELAQVRAALRASR